jgi:hypothetical protein
VRITIGECGDIAHLSRRVGLQEIARLQLRACVGKIVAPGLGIAGIDLVQWRPAGDNIGSQG